MKYTQAVTLHTQWTLTKIIGTKRWRTASEFIWYLNYGDFKNNYVIVPRDFEHDFWSIPRMLWWLFNPTAYTAYILHDWLYENKEYSVSEILKQSLTRKQADVMLIEALEVEGMGWVWRTMVYLAVRAFWWWYWYDVDEKISLIFKKILWKK